MRRWLLALALIAGAAQAEPERRGCTDDIEAALRAVNPKAEIAGDVVSQHCKAWPPSAGKVTAAVMAFEQADKSTSANWRERTWIVVLALLDTRTQRVKQFRRAEVSEDVTTAVGDNSFTLDTAAYNLAPGLRALGLRFSSSAPGPSAPDGLSGDPLTLFEPEGRTLRPVFSAAMWFWKAAEGRCLRSCPNPVWMEAKLSVRVGSRGSTGRNDLLMDAAITRETAEADAPISPPRQETVIYRYSGKGYALLSPPPWWLAGGSTVAW